MGEKNSKDYSASNKKWVISFAILALVAIIVVVILVTLPPNTYNAVETLTRATSTSFLINEKENLEFNEFKIKIEGNVKVNYYSKELSSIKKLSTNVNDLLEFYNDYLLFANKNSNLNKNYKPIKNNLDRAKASQKNMHSILADSIKLSDSSSTYLQNTMVDFRREFSKWLGYMNNAILALESAYSGSLGEVIENNTASKMILSTACDYLSNINKDFEKLVELDKKGNSSTAYKFESKGKIDLFSNFIHTYIKKGERNGDISNYYFESSIQNKYLELSTFYEVYSEKSLDKIVDSIKEVGGVVKITYQPDSTVIDEKGVLSKIIKFVEGGL